MPALEQPAHNLVHRPAPDPAHDPCLAPPPKLPVPTNLERTSCLLMVSAMRTSGAPHSRKTQRHVTAFGVKVPDALEDIREFTLPRFIKLPEGEEEELDDQLLSQSQVLNSVSMEPELEDDKDDPVLEDDKYDGDEQLMGESAPGNQNSEELAASALLQL